MYCIRGATTVAENEAGTIIESTKELIQAIMEQNEIQNDDILSILFTATRDLTKANPAAGARQLGLTAAALMGMQEMYVENSLEKCIRVMVMVEIDRPQKDARHVYLRGATVLRPDLAGRFAVALDGPSGAGKSTVAREAARELGLIYVDTGAMYRTVGLYCLRHGIPFDDHNQIIAVLNDIHIALRYIDGVQRIYLNDEDVTDAIRTREASDAASNVAVIDEVRKKLVKLQQEIGRKENVIMDGRDIASIVLPWAQVKIYLDADAHERSLRRLRDLLEKGVESDYEMVRKEIEERDYRDSTREHSPLQISKNAIRLDTSHMTLVEVTSRVVELCKETLAKWSGK